MVVLRRTGILVICLSLITACKGGDAGKEQSADASAPIWPLSTKSVEARSHIELGERAADEGRPLDAYEQFKRAVASDSAFAYGYLRVSDFPLSFDEYKANLERAKAYESTANPTEKMLIDIAQKLFVRDQQGALELAQELVRYSRRTRAHALGVGEQAILRRGQLNDTRLVIEERQSISPRIMAEHTSSSGASGFPSRKTSSKAEQEVLAGGKLWPDKPLSYDYLGDVRRAQGRLEGSSRGVLAADRAVADAGGRPMTSVDMPDTFLGEYDKARADYDAAARIGEGNEPVVAAQYRRVRGCL